MNPNIQGAIWAILATAFFALGAAMAKGVVSEFHVLQILFFRQLVVFASALPVVLRTFPNSLKTRHPGLHLVRLLGAFVALSSGIWAVAVLPLTSATTLGFTKVFLVVLLASRFLSEAVGPSRWTAVGVGFLGVLIVIRPGVAGLNDWHVAVPIVGAFGAALAQICVRRLSQTESTASLLTYQAIFIGLMSGAPLYWFWVTPDAAGLLKLLLIGVLATAGQWLAVRALRLGEASIISNIQYIQLVYAAALGYLIFGEVPDQATLMGAAIIVVSAIVLLRRESAGRSKQTLSAHQLPVQIQPGNRQSH